MSTREKPKAMTFRQLRDQLNALPDESLDYKVQWCGEERGGAIGKVWILEEDHVNPSGDGWEPRSSLEHDMIKVEGMTAFEAGELLDEHVVGRKGQPVLMDVEVC